MKNINEITGEEVKNMEYILTDIDGTLTNDGPMLPKAYEALWRLHNAGFKIIPVTGRTAGWASVNITDWPVEAIIAESGSVAFYLENGSRKSFIHPSVSGDIAAEHEKILSAVRAKYPDVKVTIISFQFSDLESLRKVCDNDLMYLVQKIEPEDIELAKSIDNCGIDFNANKEENWENDAQIIKDCQAAGLKLGGWTVDKLEVMQKLLDVGVDMVTTNCITY